MNRCWLLVMGLWPLFLQAQSLPLNRTQYRIEITSGSYNCKLTEQGQEYDCKAWPAPTPWMELRWDDQMQAYALYIPVQDPNTYAYQTVFSGLYLDNQCRFIQSSWDLLHQAYCQAAGPIAGCNYYDPFLQAWPLYNFYCPYDPGQQQMWIVWLADYIVPMNLGPKRLSRNVVDYDPDRDEIVGEPGYPYFGDSETLPLYLVVYHHNKPDLKYAAIITQTSYMRWLDVLLFKVYAEGNYLGPVATEPLPEPSDPTLSIFPNPAHEVLHVRFTLKAPTAVALTLYDLLGRPVYALPVQPYPAGTHQLQIRRGGWPAGLYLLRLTLGSQTYTRTISWL